MASTHSGSAKDPDDLLADVTRTIRDFPREWSAADGPSKVAMALILLLNLGFFVFALGFVLIVGLLDRLIPKGVQDWINYSAMPAISVLVMLLLVVMLFFGNCV